MSAPAKPGVCSASLWISTASETLIGFRCTLKMASRPLTSGLSMVIWRSKRPGRNNAVSNTSGRLVAANTIMPLSPLNPSISTSNWFSVLSRSSLLMMAFFPRARPMASISSINIIQGAFSRACLNRSRTRLAPTPTNISTKSEPLRLKKGTCASPATALANRVLPVPGGPTNNAPFGIFPPRLVYFLGFFRKSTISITSTFASSNPATSLNVIFTFVPLSNSWALDLPILKMPPGPAPPPPPPPIFRINNTQISTITKMGSTNWKIGASQSPSVSSILGTSFTPGFFW